jgi:hypothetical protein
LSSDSPVCYWINSAGLLPQGVYAKAHAYLERSMALDEQEVEPILAVGNSKAA